MSVVDRIDKFDKISKVELYRKNLDGSEVWQYLSENGKEELLSLARIGERMNYISVSEEIPKKGQICDIFFQFANGVHRVCEVTFTSKTKGFDHGVFPLDSVTHWRLSEADRPGV